MRILFVRHGHPNYALDCLTELGHEHAEAAAARLENEGICEIHSSSCGRAVETAQHTADRLGLEVIQHDFMRELDWGPEAGAELPNGGNPWSEAERAMQLGENLMRADWRDEGIFSSNIVKRYVDAVAVGIDGWLASLGYEREGMYYRAVRGDTNRTIAMFSHGGSSTAALAHMFSLPFPYLCRTLQPDFTAVTAVSLPDEIGMPALPTLEIANDSRHISGKGIVISR